MIFSEFLAHVNDAVRGIEEDAPAVSSDEAVYWARLYNRKKNEMYRDVDKNWESSYDAKSVGVITAAAAPSFNLDNTLEGFLAPARQAYVIDTDGDYHYYDTIKVGEIDRKDVTQKIYITGANPKVLRFVHEIEADDVIIGGTLYLPGYYLPADITGTDGDAVIAVDDPFWAVMAVAAQVAFGDLTYEEKFEDLNGQANELWRTMVKLNRKRQAGGSRETIYNVYRITSPR